MATTQYSGHCTVQWTLYSTVAVLTIVPGPLPVQVGSAGEGVWPGGQSTLCGPGVCRLVAADPWEDTLTSHHL